MLSVKGTQGDEFRDVLRVEELFAGGPTLVERLRIQAVTAGERLLGRLDVVLVQLGRLGERFFRLLFAPRRLIEKSEALLHAVVTRS